MKNKFTFILGGDSRKKEDITKDTVLERSNRVLTSRQKPFEIEEFEIIDCNCPYGYRIEVTILIGEGNE